jgi:hypothetical protein
MIVPSYSFLLQLHYKEKKNEKRRRTRYTSGIAKCENALLSTIRKEKEEKERTR